MVSENDSDNLHQHGPDPIELGQALKRVITSLAYEVPKHDLGAGSDETLADDMYLTPSDPEVQAQVGQELADDDDGEEDEDPIRSYPELTAMIEASNGEIGKLRKIYDDTPTPDNKRLLQRATEHGLWLDERYHDLYSDVQE